MMAGTRAPDWWATPPRAALLLLLGFVLGPHGLDVLRASAVTTLAPLLPIALASLGMLLVLNGSRHAARELLGLIVPLGLLFVLAPDLIHANAFPERGWRALQACGAAVLVGGAGALLLADTTRIARRVYLLGIVLLLGGVADFVSASALLCGAAGSLVIARFASRLGDGIMTDLQYFGRPLATAVLLLAGAQIEISDETVLLAAAWALTVVVWRRASTSQVHVGIYSVAVALDVAHGFGDDLAPLISAGALAVIAIQGIAFFSAHGETTGIAAEGAA